MSSTTPPSLFFMFVFYFCISLVSFMYVKMALPAQLAITYREGGLGVQSASPAVPFLIAGKAFVLVSPSGGVCHIHNFSHSCCFECCCFVSMVTGQSQPVALYNMLSFYKLLPR